jgi:uncharacterized membrane protein YhaH (DUF805 family)
MEWYTAVLKRYAEFSGRARRKEYWFFYPLQHPAVLIPAIAVSVRRMHDTDGSGWWVLINLIPSARRSVVPAGLTGQLRVGRQLAWLTLDMLKSGTTRGGVAVRGK